MKTDRNGVSTCPVGKEHYEFFDSQMRKGKKFVQYDYRDTDGELFSTIAATLDQARKRRDQWLKNRKK